MKKLAIALVSVGVVTTILPTAASAVESGPYNTNGTVNFMPNTDPTDPVNPLDPDPDNPVIPEDLTDPNGPNPGTKGPLSIDYASSLDFGVNKISNKTETYYARAQFFKNADSTVSSLITPNYVQVSDNRGNNAGWTLKVKQNGQFENANTLNKTLTGSAITFVNPIVKSNAQGVTAPVATPSITLDPAGAESVVFSAKKDVGAGIWTNAWGTAIETVTEQDQNGQAVEAKVNKEITLTIPGKTPKDAVKYATTLTWNLSDTPGN